MPAVDPRRRSFLLTGLLLSAIAQVALRAGASWSGLILSFLCAGAMWRALRGAETAIVSEKPTILSNPGQLYAGALTVLAVLMLQALDRAYAAQIILWVIAIALINMGTKPLTYRIAKGPVPWVFALLVAATTLRVWALDLYPAGLHGDEGSFGLWAARIAGGETIAPFALGWDYHPTLFHYAQAAAMLFVGNTIAGVRLASALFGTLTVIPLYLFLRRVLGEIPALAGSLFLTVLPWHLYFSRLAVDDIGVALCAVGAMAGLYDAARRDDAAVAAGTWLGVSFYFGHKAVLLPAMMLAGAAALHGTGRIDLRRNWRKWCLLTAVAGCVVAPQFAYYSHAGWRGPLLQHPLARLARPAGDADSAIAFAAKQVERSVLAFQLYPDRAIFLSFTDVPLLPAGIAALAFVGFLTCAIRIRQPLHAFLLAWFATGLLASILTHDPPQAHHLVPMVAVPIIFAAIAVAELAAQRLKPLLAAVLILVTVDAGREAWLAYMRPAPWMEVTEIAQAMRDLHRSHDVILITAPMADSNGTLQYIAGPAMRASAKLYGPLKEPWHGPGTRDIAFIVSRRRYEELPRLRHWYPDRREYKYATAPGADFLTIIEVPRNTVPSSR